MVFIGCDDRGKDGLFQAEKTACAPLIEIPVGMVQVTGSLLKQTANGWKKKMIYLLVFASKSGGKKNRK